jgi:tRNA G37 N-methylase Trm5
MCIKAKYIFGIIATLSLAALIVIGCVVVNQIDEETKIDNQRIEQQFEDTNGIYEVTKKEVTSSGTYRIFYNIHLNRYATSNDTIYEEKDIEKYIAVTSEMFDSISVGDQIDTINIRKVENEE